MLQGVLNTSIDSMYFRIIFIKSKEFHNFQISYIALSQNILYFMKFKSKYFSFLIDKKIKFRPNLLIFVSIDTESSWTMRFRFDCLIDDINILNIVFQIIPLNSCPNFSGCKKCTFHCFLWYNEITTQHEWDIPTPSKHPNAGNHYCDARKFIGWAMRARVCVFVNGSYFRRLFIVVAICTSGMSSLLSIIKMTFDDK